MEYGLDTSALLRILPTDPPALAEKVAATLQGIVAEGGILHVSDTVVCEAYHALQHHYCSTKENAISDLRSLSQTPGFRFSDGAKAALAEPNAARMSPGLVDRMIADGYAAEGFRTVSCEKSFRKIPGAVVVA